METCRVCGRSPALNVRLRRQVGMIIMMKWNTFKGALCKEHGVPLAQDYLKKTAVGGWWSILAIIMNPFAIVMDWLALSKLKKLPDPQ